MNSFQYCGETENILAQAGRYIENKSVEMGFPRITLDGFVPDAKFEDTAFLQTPDLHTVRSPVEPAAPQYLTVRQVEDLLGISQQVPSVKKDEPVPEKKGLHCPEHWNLLVPSDDPETLVCPVIQCDTTARKES